MTQEVDWVHGTLDPEVIRAFGDTVLDEAAVLEVTLSSGDPSARLQGPELMIHLLLSDGLNEEHVGALINRLTARWSQHETIAERVDSIGVALHSAGSRPAAGSRLVS